MKIEKNLANEIVIKLSETIGQNINIMDTDGVIIASSDPSRVGMVHGGAIKLMNEQLPQVIVESNDQFEGSRSGVNLPIVFEDEVVGTIGITGDVSEVLKYGQIIKHMTEILLLESRTREQSVIEQKARDRFYDEWILGSLEEKNLEEFERMANALSIDYSKPYRLLSLSLGRDQSLSVDTLSDISKYIRTIIRRKLSGNAFRTATHMVCIIEEEHFSLIEEVMRSIKAEIETRYSCRLKIGSDNMPETLHLNSGYERATLAMEMALSTDSDEVITYYDDYDINFILKGISSEAKSNYIKRLFKNASDNDIKEALDFARVYLNENGSINAISERLFVHKNTIKYRISKLTQMTGVDIRTCYGAYVFTLACML